MGEGAKGELLQFMNDCAETGVFPDTWAKAQVVGIFKKGCATLAENYRPISLLNTTYKLYAAILARRLHEVVAKSLGETQF
eukprot:7157959-Alexandrium_andersonii.AAC.1